jgi:DNA-formamidopyrimidine glycosylase
MPEGPEVACLAEELNKNLQNKVINNFEFIGGRYIKHSLPEYFEEFKECLPLKIIKIEYKGKLIIFHFEKNWYMFNTLGMSGCWTYNKLKHSHVLIEYSLQGSEGYDDNKKIYFTDVRRFGTIIFTNDTKIYEKKLKSIANGFLGNYKITLKEFKNNVKKHLNKNISKGLMDQKSICSGVGNYLLSELVFDTGINPFLNFSDLDDDLIENLYESCNRLINDSYSNGGTSIKNYTDMNGEDGDNYYNLKVYGREEDPDGFEILKITGPHGRTLWLSTCYYWVDDLKNN